MVKYTCGRCGHTFEQKQHLERHITRKIPCNDLNSLITNIVDLKIDKKLKNEKLKNEQLKTKHSKGQYFTTNEYLKNCVWSLIENDPKIILEPSMGQGDLIDYIKVKNESVVFDMYEIDNTIQILKSINPDQIKYGDFLTTKINTTYDTIVGNPPYVKTKTGNLYIDFITKCYHLLNDNGELIFIVPSDFIKLTSSTSIINTMMDNGTFTHIICPNDESLFKNASIDVIIFRYCKNLSLPKLVFVNDIKKFLINTNGILTFSDNDQKNMSKISEYFDIHVGMVTGRESVFKNSTYGNIELLNDKNIVDKYILLNNFPTSDNSLNTYMLSHKDNLINRKIKKFSEKNWFEWGALRNYNTIKNKLGDNCIYVNNLTRKNEICFEGNVQYFGGRLLIMIPKSNINIQKMVEYMNSDIFRNNYIYAGRFKIGHKQLCNSLFDPHFS